MKRAVAIIAGLALTGGMATATEQLQQEAEEHDQNRSLVNEDERQSRTGVGEPTSTGEYGTQTESELGTQSSSTYGAETSKGVSEMSSAALIGRAVVTDDGGLVGTIQEVGYSETHQARVAAVDVGGFVGAGEKVIAIPLAELNQGSDQGLVTQMTEESIENREEFDMSDLTPDR